MDPSQNGKEAVEAEGMSRGIEDVMTDLASEMKTSLPTEFSMGINTNIKDAAALTGTAGLGFSSLITIEQMVVRSEDDIRSISGELYRLIERGERARGVLAFS